MQNVIPSTESASKATLCAELMHIMLILATALLVACAPKAPVNMVTDIPSGGWVSIFNGRDLTGWTPKIAGENVGVNYHDTFRVKDGVLVVDYDKYERFDNHFGSLFYNKPLSHYWLRVEYRFVGERAPGSPRWTYKNSGLQLHGQAPDSMRKEQQFPVSVEFDLVGGWYVGSRPTGDVCQTGTRVAISGAPLAGQCSKLSDLTIRDDRWVVAVAKVEGSAHVRQIVDGREIVEYSNIVLDEGNPDAQRLIAAGAPRSLESGYLSLQSNGHPVEFRRIEVLPLDADTALNVKEP